MSLGVIRFSSPGLTFGRSAVSDFVCPVRHSSILESDFRPRPGEAAGAEIACHKMVGFRGDRHLLSGAEIEGAIDFLRYHSA